MAFSLFQLASLVQQNVSGGLRGQQNFTYDLEQLQDEIVADRNALLKALEGKGEKLPYDACAQPLNARPLAPADYAALPAGIAELAGLEDQVRRPVLHFTFPALINLTDMDAVVRYVGPVSRRTRWRVATRPQQVEYDQYTRARSTVPLVYFDQSTPGEGWVLGCPVAPRAISLTAIFDEPLKVGHYPPNQFNEESLFPMPDYLATAIVTQKTNKYISQYGRLNPRPNDGTAQV